MLPWNFHWKLRTRDIEAILSKMNEPLLVSYECFDLFTDPSGEKIATDRKSLAYRFDYRRLDKTLKTNEVDQAHKGVIDHLLKIPGVLFR